MQHPPPLPPPAPPLPFRMNVMKLRDGKQIDTTPRKKNIIDNIQLKKEETPNPFIVEAMNEDISQISSDGMYPSEVSVCDRIMMLYLPEKIATIFYIIYRIFCIFYGFIVNILRRISIRDIIVLVVVGYVLYRYMSGSKSEESIETSTTTTTNTTTTNTTTTHLTSFDTILNDLILRVSSLESKEIKSKLKLSSIDTNISELRKQIESTENHLRETVVSAVEGIEVKLNNVTPYSTTDIDIALYANGARIIRSKTSKSVQIKHPGIIGYLNDLLFPAFIPPEVILYSKSSSRSGGYCTNGVVSILLPHRSTIRKLEYPTTTSTTSDGVDVYGGYNNGGGGGEIYLGRISGIVEIEPAVQVDYIQIRTNETMKCLRHLSVY